MVKQVLNYRCEICNIVHATEDEAIDCEAWCERKKLEKGCGKQLWVADINGYIPECGKDGHLCKNCSQNLNNTKSEADA